MFRVWVIAPCCHQTLLPMQRAGQRTCPACIVVLTANFLQQKDAIDRVCVFKSDLQQMHNA
jgi:hypothetical protein